MRESVLGNEKWIIILLWLLIGRSWQYVFPIQLFKTVELENYLVGYVVRIVQLFVCSFLLDAGYNLKARWVAIPTVHRFTRNLLSWWLEVRLVVFLSWQKVVSTVFFILHDCLIFCFIHHHIRFHISPDNDQISTPEGRIKVAEGVTGGARCLKNVRQ